MLNHFLYIFYWLSELLPSWRKIYPTVSKERYWYCILNWMRIRILYLIKKLCESATIVLLSLHFERLRNSMIDGSTLNIHSSRLLTLMRILDRIWILLLNLILMWIGIQFSYSDADPIRLPKTMHILILIRNNSASPVLKKLFLRVMYALEGINFVIQ